MTVLALRGDPIGAEWWVRLRCGHDGFVTSRQHPMLGQPVICWRCSATGFVKEPMVMPGGSSPCAPLSPRSPRTSPPTPRGWRPSRCPGAEIVDPGEPW